MGEGSFLYAYAVVAETGQTNTANKQRIIDKVYAIKTKKGLCGHLIHEPLPTLKDFYYRVHSLSVSKSQRLWDLNWAIPELVC